MWTVGGLVWKLCGKIVGFSTELPRVREAKSTDYPHGIRPPGSSYLPTDFSEEPTGYTFGITHYQTMLGNSSLHKNFSEGSLFQVFDRKSLIAFSKHFVGEEQAMNQLGSCVGKT